MTEMTDTRTRDHLAWGLSIRTDVRPSDVAAVRRIVASSGFFRDAEVDVAAELVQERLARGAASGYEFVFLDQGELPVGYACFGLIPCTVASFDLYWIAVDADQRSQGWGSILLAEAERDIARLGGQRIYVETSTRALYAPTREFYERRGYRVVAELEDFYAPGDGKVIFYKPAPAA